MMGKRPCSCPEITAVLEEDVGGPPEKARYARVLVTGTPGAWRARPTGGAASHLLATGPRATGLAVIPPGPPMAKAGDGVTVSLFRDPGCSTGGSEHAPG